MTGERTPREGLRVGRARTRPAGRGRRGVRAVAAAAARPLTRLLAVLVVVAPLAPACSGGIRPEALQAWVGRPAAVLQKEWGPPTREVPEGELRILVYEEVERRATTTLEGAASAYRREAIQAPPDETQRGLTVYVRSYLFWVDTEGKIVRTAVRTP